MVIDLPSLMACPDGIGTIIYILFLSTAKADEADNDVTCMVYECGDVIQAAINIIYRCGYDLQEVMDVVTEKNMSRGYYNAE